MTRVALPLLGAFALAALGGCQTAPAPVGEERPPLAVRFFLEAKPDEAGIAVTLPQSGVRVTLAPKPVLVEYDIANAEVAQVDLGRCLLVQFSPAAARDLYRLSVAAAGRRLVVSLNDEFLGARRLDGAIGDGSVLVFLEVPDEKLAEIVARVKSTTAQLARATRKGEP
jgi:hypothetical protein